VRGWVSWWVDVTPRERGMVQPRPRPEKEGEKGEQARVPVFPSAACDLAKQRKGENG